MGKIRNSTDKKLCAGEKTSTIPELFARQKTQKSVKIVACPICQNEIPLSYINGHIDSGCMVPTTASDSRVNDDETIIKPCLTKLKRNLSSKESEPIHFEDAKTFSAKKPRYELETQTLNSSNFSRNITPTKVNPFATPTKSKILWKDKSSFSSPVRSSPSKELEIVRSPSRQKTVCKPVRQLLLCLDDAERGDKTTFQNARVSDLQKSDSPLKSPAHSSTIVANSPPTFQINPGVNGLAKSYREADFKTPPCSPSKSVSSPFSKRRTSLSSPSGPGPLSSPASSISLLLPLLPKSSPSRSGQLFSSDRSQLDNSSPAPKNPATPRSKNPSTPSRSKKTNTPLRFQNYGTPSDSRPPSPSPSSMSPHYSPNPRSIHNPNRYWNKQRISPRNEDALSSVTRRLSMDEDRDESHSKDGSKSSAPFSPAKSPTKSRRPYYLENFLVILGAIASSSSDWNLFSDEDRRWFAGFIPGEDPENTEVLSEEAQLLFVRLFQRKHRWLRAEQIKYDEIAVILKPFFEELRERGFLLEAEDHLNDLTTAMDLLSAPDLKALAKHQQIVFKNGQASRAEMIDALLTHCARQKSILDFAKTGPSEIPESQKRKSFGSVGQSARMLKKAKTILGASFRVSDKARATFCRAMLLFDMCGVWLEAVEDSSRNQGDPMFKMLLANTGKTIYPDYKVERISTVFRSRHDLDALSRAYSVEMEMKKLMENSRWEQAFLLFKEKEDWCRETISKEDITTHALSLPFHMRRYTEGWSCVKILDYGVDLLERRKDYPNACDLLETLLTQNVYCSDSRGKWYDRLTLNLDYHSRNPNLAWEKVIEALKDEKVRLGRRLSVFTRGQKLSKKEKFNLDVLPKDLHMDIRKAPKRTITGTLVPGMTGFYVSPIVSTTPRKSPSVDKNGFEAIRVEEFTLRYYKNNLGYSEGIHSEGSIFFAIYVLLFWDVIFMSGIPDVFWNPYQSMPLDLFTDDFYAHRKSQIDNRNAEIEAADEGELCRRIESAWESHQGTRVAGINWERFESFTLFTDLIVAMGATAGKHLAAIFHRLAINLRHSRSGMPDLCMWNSDTKRWILVEVKGPNDRLSTKQMLWLDYFLSSDIPCEVCHVIVVSGKKLKRKGASPSKNENVKTENLESKSDMQLSAATL